MSQITLSRVRHAFHVCALLYIDRPLSGAFELLNDVRTLIFWPSDYLFQPLQQAFWVSRQPKWCLTFQAMTKNLIRGYACLSRPVLPSVTTSSSSLNDLILYQRYGGQAFQMQAMIHAEHTELSMTAETTGDTVHDVSSAVSSARHTMLHG